MIITRTPLRVSFCGGGTDLPSYYLKQQGAVLSTAVNKYIYITVNRLSPYFAHSILLKYSQTELVDSVEEIRHPIIREAMKLTGIVDRVEITSMADIPAGTGLGSSSSYAVALLHALHTLKGEYVSAGQLAKEACEIEIQRLGDPIGKQDQYIAAYGGICHLRFNPDESVFVDPVICSYETKKALGRKPSHFLHGRHKTRRRYTRSTKGHHRSKNGCFVPHERPLLRSIRCAAGGKIAPSIWGNTARGLEMETNSRGFNNEQCD